MAVRSSPGGSVGDLHDEVLRAPGPAPDAAAPTASGQDGDQQRERSSERVMRVLP